MFTGLLLCIILTESHTAKKLREIKKLPSKLHTLQRYFLDCVFDKLRALV